MTDTPPMKTSSLGRKLIEQFEGLRLVAYQDSRGIWTIGYGHTAEVNPGETCTTAQADLWLAEDLATAEGAINRLVKVPLNQNQFDALVSLCFNIGQGHFSTSTVLLRLNQGAYALAAAAILLWRNPGLLTRRQAEQKLFLTPVSIAPRG